MKIPPIDICTDMSNNAIRHVFEHEGVLSFQQIFGAELSNGVGYLM